MWTTKEEGRECARKEKKKMAKRSLISLSVMFVPLFCDGDSDGAWACLASLGLSF